MVKWQRALYQPSIPLGRERVTACAAHKTLAKEAAKEGMVLLKNENKTLPLEKGQRLALFGKGTFDYVKGGGGSGDVTVEYTVNLYQGLKELCTEGSICEELAEFYRENVKEQYKKGAEPGMTVEPELSDELCTKARSFADTAVISICRFSGEDWDRKSKYDKQDAGSSIFEEGDFYLTRAERAMVNKVKSYFDKIVVVLNVGGMVDTDWFICDEKLPAVLMAWQGGMEGGRAAAELLLGIGNPSGKLSDTFARNLEDYPSSWNFHESDAYVDYCEDIYVGYRYFETIPGAGDRVNYPFGYGLSYTDFAWTVLRVKQKEDEIQLVVQVTNMGDRPGKEVIQVYAQAPQGVLGKAKRHLAAFRKTRLLAPGESQVLVLWWDMKALASYDDLGKLWKSAYVLEKGAYHFYVGNSVRNTEKVDFECVLSENRIVSVLTPKIVPTSLKKRMLSDGEFEELPLSMANDPDFCEIAPMDKKKIDGVSPQIRGLMGTNLWSQPFKKGVRPLMEVFEGKMNVRDFLSQMTDEEVAHLLGGQPNTGVANTFGFGNMPEYGIPNIMTADGPAGLRIAPLCGVCTTAWPCSTMLACTWNPELVYQVGEAGAKEVKENNISVWLTPAVNIHRSPLCGRNFEYYSEDPFLTGKMAAAMVRGIQSQHIAATVKHFALNNKETNRKNSDSRVSERAAREIYLKAFEIIVKEAAPWCLMTSYNIINGHRASENKDLITGILREEWGYQGMVTTDWWTYGEHYKEVKAGNDIKMATGLPERLMEALQKGVLTREEMEACAARILELILKVD